MIFRCTLGVVALLFLALMALGAATRLTGSGLSMTTWQPLIEFPPRASEEWQQTFDRYLRSPEGRGVNKDISMSEFRRIFWWEWGHRSLARGIVVFLLGLLVWQGVRQGMRKGMHKGMRKGAKRAAERVLFLGGLLLLTGLQGLLGWVMVQSGLREVARVSPYLLAMHLSFALGLLLLIARGLWREGFFGGALRVSSFLRRVGLGVASLSLATFVLGAFVAGVDGGGVHNDWPLMSGSLFPSDYVLLEPWWRNALENPSAVQFEHRFAALLLFLGCVGLFCGLRRFLGFADGHVWLLLLLPLLQVLLGGLALRLEVPVLLGVLHHVVGVLLVVLLFVLSWRLKREGGD